MATGARAALLMKERLVLLLLICVFLPTVNSQSQPWIGNLSAYEIASFKNPVQVKQIVKTQLDHFSVHPDTGDVYVGAVNYIYRLDGNLVQVVNVSTATGVEEEDVNYNKILVLQGGRLITCGNQRNPAMGIRWCASRNEDDLLEDGLTGQIDAEVAAFGNYTTESIVAPGLYNGGSVSRLYVATTYCDEGCDTWSVPPVSRRLLVSGDGFMFGHLDGDYVRLNQNSVGALFPISYVSSFIWKEFTYFLAFQKEDAYRYSAHVSKMNRVCHDSPNLDSYTEIVIQCDSQDGDSSYTLVQAAHVGPAGPDLSQSLSLNAGEEVLYAVFAKNAANPAVTDVPQPKKGSALCMYKMGDIETAFEAAVDGCLTVGTAYSTGYLADNRCLGTSTQPSSPDLYCDAMSRYKYASGITPVVSTAVLELPEHLTSSIITSIELDHTVAFIGTTEAQLLKVHIESGSSARVYEQIPIPFDDNLKRFTANPVKRDMKINDATGELHLLTEQKLVKMRVENCGQYTTCKTCIGTDAEMDGDPYCGWCTLQRKCTRYNECLLPDVSSRWLSYNDPQCIKITDIAPYDNHPITAAEQQITLTVQQLPDLPNSQQYICNFDKVFSDPANKFGDTLQCTTPPSNLIPDIMMADDHSSMLLSVESTETGVNFVDREFSFYDCSIHESCVSCVGSRWACDWCVFENRCTHESTSCSGQNEVIVTGLSNKGSSMQGPDSCPQLQIQGGETLVSTGVDRQIIVQTENLPDPAQIKSYQCSLNIEGGKQSAKAIRENDILTCEDYSYTYMADEQKLNVDLTVEWTDTNDDTHLLDDRYGFKVRLYKCESLRPDCSRCVSEVTTQEELGCVWCDGTCAVTDSAICLMTNSMVTRDNGLNCPDPVIEEIFPLAGPVNRNTNLTLYGTDFGRRFSDIQAVTVGGRTCDFAELQVYYHTGSSVTCLTRNNPDDQAPQELIVYVTGLNGNLQTGSGDVFFGYKVPSITSFSPRFGPAAGGTRITINGMALNTGRNIQAFIGDTACNITSPVTETEAVCTSSEGSVGQKEVLKMSFDGADRTSEVYNFTNNPVITEVSPTKSIYAGGREMVVRGTHLDTTQMASLVVTVASQITKRSVRSEGPNDIEFVEKCAVEGSEFMRCKTPNITSAISSSLSELNVTFGFIMDGVSDLLTWSEDNDVDLEFFLDPEYDKFENDLFEKKGELMTIKGKQIDKAITASEIIVYVGPVRCAVTFIEDSSLGCNLPKEKPSDGDFKGQDTERGLPVVWVIHSNLEFRIGYCSYPVDLVPFIVPSVSGVVLVCIFFLVLCFITQLYGSKREAKLIQKDMRALEEDLSDKIKQAFAELQTDLTDLTSDLHGIGMPFVSHQEYASNMLFIGQERPDTQDKEYPDENVQKAMMRFSRLLSNKAFLIVLIQTLDAESNSKLSIRQKQLIASLLTLTMIMENKLTYLTDIMITLMTELIQTAADNGRTRQLFHRNESILEKLLSNWVALCLYDQLQRHTAYPLFVLYRAIKHVSESGPVDVFTGRSRFSLNFEKMLQEDIEFNTLTIIVLIDVKGTVIKEVKVQDVDTISQVKEKILDALHLNKPYSSRPSANQVSLEWHRGTSGRLVLTDMDLRPPTDKWRRINMLKEFHVRNNDQMTIVERQEVDNATLSRPILKFSQGNEESAYVNVGFDDLGSNKRYSKRRYTVVEVETTEGIKDWHLVKEDNSGYDDDDDEEDGKKTKPKECCSGLRSVTFRNKITRRKIKEISFPRLMSTKGIVQKYVDDMFNTILSVESAPKAIKYLFDFFDSQAIRHDLEESDPEITHIWKSNILPLRFWSNAIKHPDYIFDILPSRSVGASMDVIGQLFHDVHDTKTHKLGQESSVNKLLYGREKQKYQHVVEDFYNGVRDLSPVPTQELNKELYKACENFTGLFSKLDTLERLWNIVNKFNPKILDVLESEPEYEEAHLGYLLEEVQVTLSSGDEAL